MKINNKEIILNPLKLKPGIKALNALGIDVSLIKKPNKTYILHCEGQNLGELKSFEQIRPFMVYQIYFAIDKGLVDNGYFRSCYYAGYGRVITEIKILGSSGVVADSATTNISLTGIFADTLKLFRHIEQENLLS